MPINWNAVSFNVIIVTFILAVAAIIVVVLVLDYKKSKYTKQKKMDPVQKGILTGLGVSLLLVFAEGIGSLPQGWNRKHIWVHLAVYAILIGLFWIGAKQKALMPEHKLRKIALKKLSEIFDAEIYTGSAHIDPMDFYGISEQGMREEVRGVVASYIFPLKSATKQEFLIQLNAITGDFLWIDPLPSESTKQKIKNYDLAPQKAITGFDEYLEDQNVSAQESRPQAS